jgi:plastocyanin
MFAASSAAAACSSAQSGKPQDASVVGEMDHAAGVDAGADSGAVEVMVGPVGDHRFLPPVVTVDAGTTVRWFWTSAGHNVVSGANGVADGLFCSPSNQNCASAPVSAAGASFDYTFTKPGTYPYFCAPHYSVGMKGTVVVQ